MLSPPKKEQPENPFAVDGVAPPPKKEQPENPFAVDGVATIRQKESRFFVVEALIDGDSELHLTPKGIFWKQGVWNRPGRDENHNYPTYVNDREWVPDWGDN